MTIKIVIDSRELKIKNLFSENSDSLNNDFNLVIENKSLDVGDFIFKYNDDVILVIERKTISDLYSSIQDGRYREQKFRMMQNYDKSKLVYLIEGEIHNNSNFKNYKSIVNGALINAIFRDEIKVIRTIGLKETYEILLLLAKKINKNFDYFIKDKVKVDSTNTSSDSDTNYENTLKMKKKNNFTPEIFNVTVISQIPGVSIHIAKCILDKYKNISNLINTYNSLESSVEKENLLKNLSFSRSEGKTRKIGPVLSKRVFNYLII